MYISTYKLTPFREAGVEVRINLCGGILPERPEMYILSYKLALCYGSGI